jgi:uncharacterized PurR-regulated membrane protein YhhQ (DUF165 family)
MKKSEPSAKVAIAVASLYVLLLFIPTLDVVATYNINLYFYTIPVSVAGFVFPAVYPLSDSVTEVYGKKTSYYLVIVCYVAAISLSFFNNLLLSLSPNSVSYDFMRQSSLLLTAIGPIGYFLTALLNVKFLNKLKIKMRGKHFIFRSLICSGISEVLISFIIYPVIFYQNGWSYVILIMIGTSLVKILLTIPMVFIAKFLVSLYRYIDHLNVVSYNTSFSEALKEN